MTSVQNVLSTVLARLLETQPLTPAKVEFAWRTAVGPAVARASRVQLTPEGVLDVVADGAHWMNEIVRSRSVITARLEHMLGSGVVRNVAVRDGSVPHRA